jgi:hypothetical protein
MGTEINCVDEWLIADYIMYDVKRQEGMHWICDKQHMKFQKEED